MGQIAQAGLQRCDLPLNLLIPLFQRSQEPQVFSNLWIVFSKVRHLLNHVKLLVPELLELLQLIQTFLHLARFGLNYTGTCLSKLNRIQIG